jgi:hypothetical protein
MYFQRSIRTTSAMSAFSGEAEARRNRIEDQRLRRFRCRE